MSPEVSAAAKLDPEGFVKLSRYGIAYLASRGAAPKTELHVHQWEEGYRTGDEVVEWCRCGKSMRTRFVAPAPTPEPCGCAECRRVGDGPTPERSAEDALLDEIEELARLQGGDPVTARNVLRRCDSLRQRCRRREKVIAGVAKRLRNAHEGECRRAGGDPENFCSTYLACASELEGRER